MDKRFLARGKRIDNGKWVVGYPYVTHSGKYEIGAYNPDLNIERCTYVVYPATVGKCTGFTAAKSYRGDSEDDRLVFEGDIVESISYNELFSIDGELFKPLRRKYVVEYRHGQLLLVERYTQYGSDAETEWCMCTQGGNDLEIIGTVHDNPELLGGKAST